MKTYLDSVGLFAGYLERSGMSTRLDAITREHVEAFIAAELERVSPSSVHIRYAGSSSSSSGRSLSGRDRRLAVRRRLPVRPSGWQ